MPINYVISTTTFAINEKECFYGTYLEVHYRYTWHSYCGLICTHIGND